MIVTIDEARVGHPSIKLDGMELAGMVKSYTLHHAVDEATTLELELLPGTDLSEVKAILDSPNVFVSVPAELDETTETRQNLILDKEQRRRCFLYCLKP